MNLLMRVSTLGDPVAVDRELEIARSGWAVLPVRPNFRESGQVLWSDLVQALGHEVTSSFRGRADANSKAIALSWLAAGPVDDLVVAGAHLLPPKSLTELASVVTAAGVRAWLLYDIEPCDEREEAEGRLGPTAVDLTEFLDRRRRAPGPLEDATPEPFPSVPDVHFMGFLDTADRVVAAEQLDRVQRSYTDALEQMRTKLAGRSEMDEPTLAMLLHEITHGTNDLNELTCLVKGAQAASLQQGWFARVDVAQWARRGTLTGLSQAFSQKDWAAISRLYRPHEAAACALSAIGISPEEMPDVSTGEISDDGSSVSHDGTEHSVPEPARKLLLAQLVYREFLDVAGDNFLAGPSQPRTSALWAGRLLLTVTRDTGVLLRGWNGSRKSLKSTGWTHRLGLAVTRLAS